MKTPQGFCSWPSSHCQPLYGTYDYCVKVEWHQIYYIFFTCDYVIFYRNNYNPLEIIYCEIPRDLQTTTSNKKPLRLSSNT